MAKRKLAAVGYKKEFVDYEDDSEYLSFISDMDSLILKQDDEWRKKLADGLFGSEWKLEIDKYLTSLNIDSNQSRAIIADELLNVIIAKKYNDSNSAQLLTANSFTEQMTATSGLQFSCTGPELEEAIKKLCQVLGITVHPDPMISLKAACLFIKRNLGMDTINERNAEDKSKIKTFELKSFPLGRDASKDGAVAAATRILRLLSLETLRSTQTMINETLAALQALSIDKTKRPDTSQVLYGR